MSKVIFLDVDGPLIPGRMYMTLERTHRWDDGGTDQPQVIGYRFDPIAVSMLRRLINATGAVIVFNTAHNCRGLDILEDALVAGFTQDEFHAHPQTEYPGPDTQAGYQIFGAQMSRLWAIEKWLNKNPGVDRWVAIDDEEISHANAVLIDFDNGFTVDDYRKALAILNGPMSEFGEDNAEAGITGIAAKTAEDKRAHKLDEEPAGDAS